MRRPSLASSAQSQRRVPLRVSRCRATRPSSPRLATAAARTAAFAFAHAAWARERLRVRLRRDRVAEPHAGHPVDLREGPGHDHVGEALDRVERGTVGGGLDEVVVGLVHQHGRGRGDLGEEGLELVAAHDRARRVVGVADVDEAGARVAGASHGGEVVPEIGGERHLDRLGLRDLRVVEDRLEGGLRRDHRSARPEEGGVAQAQDLARAAPEDDAIGAHAVQASDRVRRLLLGRVRVAPGHGLRPGHGREGRRRRAVRVLVRAEVDDAGRRRLRRRRGGQRRADGGRAQRHAQGGGEATAGKRRCGMDHLDLPGYGDKLLQSRLVRWPQSRRGGST